MKIKIRIPIWKDQAVGINTKSIEGDGTLEVEILYTDKMGNRTYPGIYRMTNQKAREQKRSQLVKGNVLKIIPIHEFEKEIQ